MTKNQRRLGLVNLPAHMLLMGENNQTTHRLYDKLATRTDWVRYEIEL